MDFAVPTDAGLAGRDPALAHVVQRIRDASQAGTPLRIRGGGTKDFYGQSLQGEVLDTTALCGITSYEPSELFVTVRAGTKLAELEAVLAARGQCLPFEPPHFGEATTVGGMVAAGLSGPARAGVGPVRDYVLGLTLVNGRGELLVFGGQVMKNVAGYDVSRLMVGALGTLGLIAEVSLKVVGKAPAEATLRFEFDEAGMIRRLNEWAGQPLPLNASSWVADGGHPFLYLRLRGAAAAVDAACARLLRTPGSRRMDSPETHADWTAARDLKLPWFTDGQARGQDLWRLAVPPTAAPLGVGDTMVDGFGGQRWVFADAGDVDIARRIRAATAAVGGHATLFRPADAGAGRAVPCFDALKPPLDRIHRELKKQFDPAGILNRGRMYADF